MSDQSWTAVSVVQKAAFCLFRQERIADMNHSDKPKFSGDRRVYGTSFNERGIVMKKFFRNESGQAMVFTAFAMVVLIGFGAFAVDTGRMAYEKSELQNIADAAALAAVQDLPSAQAARDTALSFARLNGMQAEGNGVLTNGDRVTANTPYKGNAKEVEVVCSREVDYLFAQVFGMTSKEISARAVASIDTAASSGVFDYAVFAGAGQASFGGSDHTLIGSIYGRDGVSLGNKAKVTGNVISTNTGVINLGNGSTVNGTVINNSGAIPMPDFADLIKEQGVFCAGQSQLNAVINGKEVNGAIYVDGNIVINGRVKGTGVIYATGTIKFANDTIMQTASDHILFYAGTGGMTFNGGSGVNVGILYAPNGKITVNGAPNSTTYGRLIAKYIDFNGAKASIYAGQGDLNSLTVLSDYKLVE